MHPSTQACSPSALHPFTNPSFRQFLQTFTHLLLYSLPFSSIYPSLHLGTPPHLYPSTGLSINSSTLLFIPPTSTYPIICLHLPSFTHLLIHPSFIHPSIYPSNHLLQHFFFFFSLSSPISKKVEVSFTSTGSVRTETEHVYELLKGSGTTGLMRALWCSPVSQTP